MRALTWWRRASLCSGLKSGRAEPLPLPPPALRPALCFCGALLSTGAGTAAAKAAPGMKALAVASKLDERSFLSALLLGESVPSLVLSATAGAAVATAGFEVATEPEPAASSFAAATGAAGAAEAAASSAFRLLDMTES
jgi:hypothetical protein